MIVKQLKMKQKHKGTDFVSIGTLAASWLWNILADKRTVHDDKEKNRPDQGFNAASPFT